MASAELGLNGESVIVREDGVCGRPLSYAGGGAPGCDAGGVGVLLGNNGTDGSTGDVAFMSPGGGGCRLMLAPVALENDDDSSSKVGRLADVSRISIVSPPRAVAPSASSSAVSCVWDLVKEARSSRMGWYRMSGFFETTA